MDFGIFTATNRYREGFASAPIINGLSPKVRVTNVPEDLALAEVSLALLRAGYPASREIIFGADVLIDRRDWPLDEIEFPQQIDFSSM